MPNGQHWTYNPESYKYKHTNHWNFNPAHILPCWTMTSFQVRACEEDFSISKMFFVASDCYPSTNPLSDSEVMPCTFFSQSDTGGLRADFVMSKCPDLNRMGFLPSLVKRRGWTGWSSLDSVSVSWVGSSWGGFSWTVSSVEALPSCTIATSSVITGVPKYD